MFRIKLFFFVIILFSLGSYSAQSIIINKKVDSLLLAYKIPDGPGVAVDVIKDGKIVYKNQIGYANLEYNIPITDSTDFHIASVSKQFTAFAALLLEERGKLSMDDDIKKYLPELKAIPYTVTLRQLANHTHGFANTFELAQLIGISPDEVMTHQKMIKILLNQKQLNFEPGTQYQYNNAGFALLSEIVERVSGMPFAEFMKKEVFDPLGMKHTVVYNNNALIVKNKAYSYRKTKKGIEKVPFNYTVIGGSGINTTPHDLALWAMNFDDPKIGNQKIFNIMKTPSIMKNGTTIPYAFGLETKRYKGLETIFHGGGDAGYRAYLLRIPKEQFSLVIMGNFESFNPLDLAYNITDLYLKDKEIVQKEEALPKYTTSELKKWEGDYEIFPGSFFTLKAKNDSLYIQPFRQKEMYALPVSGKQTFTYPYASHSKMVFDEAGLKWHFSDFAYPCKKVEVKIPLKSSVKLNDFTGVYWNEELKTGYHLELKNNELVATHSLNADIILKPLNKVEFYSDASYFGRVKFIRSSNNRVDSFKVSGQNLNAITFVKLK